MTHSLDAKWAALEFQRIRNAIAQGEVNEAFETADRAWRKIADAPALPSQEAEAVADCPICLKPFEPDELCSTDIELGICHASCLEGSPTVDLNTGDPIDGPIPTYRYGEASPAPTIAPVAVSVKALEWIPQHETYFQWLEATPFGPYRIYHKVSPIELIAPQLTGKFDDIEAAKAAAQSDYAARIRSAIIPAKPAGVVEALRSFAESFHFTVTDSFYSDAYLGIHEPDAITFRLGNGSQFSKHIAKLEERRKAALQGAKDGVGL